MAEVPSNVWLVTVALIFIPFTATSVTWTAPPPAWTQTDSNVIRTVDMQVLLGSTQVPLRWNYTLSAGAVQTTTFSIDGEDIGSIFHGSGIIIINNRNDYQTRFAINTSEVATLIINNVTEREEATYQCKLTVPGNTWAYNIRVTVTDKPDMVTLVTNTTENKDCSDLCVNFTCISSEANPPVYNYLLFEDGKVFSFSKSGIWIAKISRGGKVIYNCVAFQLVENVTSTNNVTLTVNVPLSMKKEEIKTITMEGGSIEVYCNVTGFPEPTVIWKNVKTGDTIEGNSLSITNITRAQAGEYMCIANNTCGEESTVVDIDVQYKPDMVTLVTNTTENKDCSDLWVNFTCISSDANPPVYNYLLFEDGKVFSFSKSGIWIAKISRGGKVIYNCVAFQLVENVTSTNNVTLTVNVPLSMKKEEIKTITMEGGSIEVYCNVTGIPEPTVIWKNVKTGDTIEGNILNIPNITRSQAGEYRCIANNTCGKESTVVDIDVQCKNMTYIQGLLTSIRGRSVGITVLNFSHNL